MTAVVISQPMLFPWPGFFEQLALADVYVHLDDAQFSKGSFTNRVQTKHPAGIRWMTVPLKGRGSFTPIARLEAADSPWRAQHRDLLVRSMGGAPHLEAALSILDRVHAKPRLIDLLTASIEEPARFLGVLPGRIEVSSRLGIAGSSWQRVLATVQHFGADRYITGHGAANYLDHQAFERAGVAVEYMDYQTAPWPQAHGPFTPYVTVLDLIAWTGPAARDHLCPKTLTWRGFLDRRRAAAQASLG